ncbi:MAG: glutamate--tRNA ligase, partial [Campylobacteraceae bacterium]|nr:glutamate--tRNA ligase [Campylobacteraceae bacterium]
CKERANTLVELKSAIENIMKVPTIYDKKGSKKFIKENTISMLEKYINILELNQDTLHLPVDIELVTKPFIEENELKFPQLFQPIRISLTGGTQAPSVYDVIAVLGVQESIKRIKTAISKNFDKEEI